MARYKAYEACPREGGDPCHIEAYTVRRRWPFLEKPERGIGKEMRL